MIDHVNFADRIASIEANHHGRESEAYRCLDCQDTRFVTVFTPETVRKACSNPDSLMNPDWDHPKHWRTCAVLCTCRAAEKHGGTWSKNSLAAGVNIPIFGEQRWHIAANRLGSKAKAAEYVHRAEGHNPEFDAFAGSP